MIVKSKRVHLFVLPAFIIFSVVFIWPSLINVMLSFSNQTHYNPNYDWIGFENYFRLFSDRIFIRSMYNTFYFTIGSSILLIGFSIPLAVGLNSLIKGASAARAIFFFPSVLSPLLVGYLFLYFLSSPISGGGINNLLQVLNLPTINFLGTPANALNSLILMNVWSFLGWHAVIYLANLRNIPNEYYEAASIDGAGSWKAFWHVTLPNLVPAFTVSTFFAIINSLKVYDQVVSLTRGGPGQGGTSTVTYHIVHTGFVQLSQGYAAAVATAFLITVTVISILYMWVTNKLERKYT